MIRQSLAGRSHYYSATRMRATGTLRVGGKKVALGGESWFDHQWGSYRDDPRAFDWDWFSCRFDDDTELMLYQFLDRQTGRPLAGFANGTFVRPERGPDAGWWLLPGGKVEFGEPVEQAARREAVEESGCDVGGLVLTGAYEIIGPGHHFVMWAYRSEQVGLVLGQLAPGVEV